MSRTYPRKRGLTLIEILIVVVIIGLLAAMAIPAMNAVRKRAQASFIANNYRIYRAEFEIYIQEFGYWPPDASRGVIPDGMEGRLNRFWEGTPSGDVWDWERDALGVSAGISLVGISTTEDTMVLVDEILDDGNLSTGQLQSNGDRYTLALQE